MAQAGVPKAILNQHEKEIIKQIILDEYESCNRKYA